MDTAQATRDVSRTSGGGGALEERQVALAARWREESQSWFGLMGHHAHELTDVDKRRIARIEKRIKTAIVAGDEGTTLRHIREWQDATLPLRWLPHGFWYGSRETREPHAIKQATYQREGSLRGVAPDELCPGNGECGGACTGRADR